MQTTPTIKKQNITKQSIEQESKDRLSRIDKEFADGFKIVNQLERTVTIFGSARFKEDNPYYQQARELSAQLGKEGFVPVTGGGGGIMEAGNRGAYEEGADTYGFNISLPHEQVLNPYTTGDMAFHYFFARKVILAYGAEAYVIFPGGFGTLDEFFEIATLIQTKKMPQAPIILMGESFWKPLDAFIKQQLLVENQAIDEGDENLYKITDSVDEAMRVIRKYCKVC